MSDDTVNRKIGGAGESNARPSGLGRNGLAVTGRGGTAERNDQRRLLYYSYAYCYSARHEGTAQTTNGDDRRR